MAPDVNNGVIPGHVSAPQGYYIPTDRTYEYLLVY